MDTAPQTDQPLLMVIFGITGDLAKRKLLPALISLYDRAALPENFKIIGVSRQQLEATAVLQGASEHSTVPLERMGSFAQHIEMRRLDPTNKADYDMLLQDLKHLSVGLGNNVVRLYYLSIPADAFEGIVNLLGETGHNEPFPGETRRPCLLVEKPFGHDRTSAETLIAAADAHFGEPQIYRIDHYLAKETAQNILTFRFDNPLFQSIWNNRHIDTISVRAYQSIGIENRAHFYESTGALRDIIQSHLLQLLALTTMEQPAQLTSTDIHRVKLRLLESILPIGPEEVASRTKRGQYQTYREEVNNPASTTETFASLKLKIDNEQWRGVDVTVETGKALAQAYSEITVHFRPTSDASGDNLLVLRLQPQEGISVLLQAKAPGLESVTKTVAMDFDYARTFHVTIPDAYERVIIDVLRGDQSLFATATEVIASWAIIENVIKYWQSTDKDLVLYPNGSDPNEL